MSHTSPTEEQEDAPVWDPVQQIYVGGRVPDTGNVQALIEANAGALPIFGYGSLCWKPGGILADDAVTRRFGQALGYQRCWCQKSTDHRGFPHFPGIVCTILHDDEVDRLLEQSREASTHPSRTEGVLYTVPPNLVLECLEELDFREKGGYAREVIDVVMDDTGETMQAALYRGTPDNPAIWPRVLRDHVYAAAVLSVAVGPSGANTEYLHNLNDFLEHHKESKEVERDETLTLARLVDTYVIAQYQFYFLNGCGSNQHNQLLLQHYQKYLVREEEVHALSEVLVGVPSQSTTSDLPVALYAGGGHSALLTKSGRLLLFGWNEMGQCGSYKMADGLEPFVAWEFPATAQSCALGFGHTLVLDEKGALWALGDNTKGQVCGTLERGAVTTPVLPTALKDVPVVTMAAGLFHSTAVTKEGRVVTWGGNDKNQSTFRWTPLNGSRAIGVACGRKFTIAWLIDGTIWSWGSDNKYGQLGRDGSVAVGEPAMVPLPWSTSDYSIISVQTGWSHVIVHLEDIHTSERIIYGWGRNDKGQLGLGHSDNVHQPTRIIMGTSLDSITCGSEFSVGVSSDGHLFACGWNEHGNLGYATPNTDCSTEWGSLRHARLVQPAGTSSEQVFPICLAAGGSHFLVGRVDSEG